MTRSVGILAWRLKDGKMEVLLGESGGPYWNINQEDLIGESGGPD